MRPFAKSDFDDLLNHRSDKRVMEYLGGIQNAEKVRTRLDFYIEHYEKHGFSMCAMIWRKSGSFIGVSGLQNVEDGSDVEVGYTVDPGFWRKGIATECTIGCLEHGFGELGLERIIAQTRADNVGSRVVLDRAGMSFLDDMDKDGEEWVRYVAYR